MDHHQSTPPHHTVKPFPPIADLFTEAWDLFTKKVKYLFFLWLLSFGANFLGILILLIIAGSFAFSRLAGHITSIESVAGFLLQPDFIITASILIVLYMIYAISVGMAYMAATILTLHDPAQEISVWEQFKKGFHFGWPLITTGGLVGILAIGAIFAAFIPYIIMIFFLMYTGYIVVLEQKKGWDALKMSAGIVSQNFWKIMGRLAVFWVAYIILFSFFPKIIPDKTGESFTAFFGLLQFVVSIVAGWYSAVYLYTLYRHAREAYDETRPGSLTWMWVVAIIGYIIAFLLGSGLYSGVKNNSSGIKNFFNSLEKQNGRNTQIPYNKPGKVMKELPLRDEEVLNAVNTVRTDNKLQPISYDQPLCAYATRRLKQLKDFGGFDDYAGFIEDTANSSIWDSYFKGYRMVNTFNWNRISGQTAQSVAEQWSINKDRSITILNPEFTNACVRSNEDFVVIVIGAKG